MRGLILKDFINLKKFIKILGAVIAIYGFMSFTQGNSSFFSTFLIMFIAIFNLSTYSYDELVKWDGYALTMPISRDTIVREKYLMMLLLTAIGSVFTAVFTIVLNYFLKSDYLLENTQACVIGAAIVILFYCIMLPFIIKLGVEKSRLILIAVYIIPYLLIMLFGKSVRNGEIKIPDTIMDLVSFVINHVYIVTPIFLLLALIISYSISRSIYRKKEF